MVNEEATIWIVFHPGIYNCRDLRSGPLERGYRFRSRSDAEVTLGLSEDCGEACRG